MEVFTPFTIKYELDIIRTANMLSNSHLLRGIMNGEQILNMRELQPFTKHPYVMMYGDNENNRAFLANYVEYMQKERANRGLSQVNMKTNTYKKYLNRSFEFPQFLTLRYCLRQATNLFIKDPEHYENINVELSEEEKAFFIKAYSSLTKKQYKEYIYSKAKDKYPYFYYDYEKADFFYLSQYTKAKQARTRYYLSEE